MLITRETLRRIRVRHRDSGHDRAAMNGPNEISGRHDALPYRFARLDSLDESDAADAREAEMLAAVAAEDVRAVKREAVRNRIVAAADHRWFGHSLLKGMGL